MKTFPLQTLLDLSNANMNGAARELGLCLASEQEVSKTLEMLIQYRDEYDNRFRDATKNGITRDEWRNYQSFFGRLDEAINHQKSLVETSKQRTANGQQEWLDKRNKVKAFDKLADRHKAQEVRREYKSEQREQDEHAAKTFRMKEQ